MMDSVGYETSPTGTQVNTVVLAFTVVAGLVVTLRLFARVILTSLFGFEDAFVIIAMVSTTDPLCESARNPADHL
jgi:hypothetical protein